MNFEFATANRIIFGPGVFEQVAPLVSDLGKKVFVLTGGVPDKADALLKQLQDYRMEVEIFSIPDTEPTVDLALESINSARKAGSEVVIGLGGGSVLDTGKVVSALLTNHGALMSYLEVIGEAQSLAIPSAPYVAVTTTAGTGSEVTRNAVLDSPQHRVKVSMRHPYMLPNVAVIDPELTHSMPPQLTASTGLDALTQVLEPYVSNKSNPFTDALCREGMQRAARSLQRVYENGTDAAAREDMSIVSLFGGLALANAKLGAVHGFAGPLGGMFHAPHGALCARLLPIVMEMNVRALHHRAPDSLYLKRYDEVAHLLTGDSQAKAEDGVQWIQTLCQQLKIPPLSEYGVGVKDCATVIPKVKNASSTRGNPIELEEGELEEILLKSL
jgi:alcohol dehydrogenase class IV